MKEQKNIWVEAARAGTIVGLALVVVKQLWIFGVPSFLVNVLMLAVNVVGIVYFLRQRSASMSRNSGFSYTQGLGFAVALMIFAGFVIGLGDYIVNTFIIPEKYQALMDQTIMQFEELGLDRDMFERSIKIVSSPIGTALSGMFSGAFMGLIIGAIAATFSKKEPNRFNDSGAI